MKTIVYILSGLVPGIVLGALAVHQWLMPELVNVELSRAAAERRLAALIEEEGGVAEEFARLEMERVRYEEEIVALEADLIAAREEATEVAPAAVTEVEHAVGGRLTAMRARFLDRQPVPVPGERAARREEMTAFTEENVRAYFSAAAEEALSPAMAERLAELEQYTLDLISLRREMDAPGSDEERTRLSEEFATTRNAMASHLTAQRAEWLGAVASDFGMTEELRQAEFSEAVAGVLEKWPSERFFALDSRENALARQGEIIQELAHEVGLEQQGDIAALEEFIRYAAEDPLFSVEPFRFIGGFQPVL